MKLTNATEKALAVVAILATQEEISLVSSNVIINRLELSPSYTKKLLRKLVVANIVDSVSGNGGGFVLKRSLKDINLLEIIEAIEGKVITYPDYGTLKYAFKEFNEALESGENVVKQIFEGADTKYKEELEAYDLEKVLKSIFKGNITKINWNEIQ